MPHPAISSRTPDRDPSLAENVPLKRWFAISVIVGASFIFVGEQVFESPMLTVGAPLAVMIVYLAIGRSYLRDGLSRAQYADSIYYMGFLFTLAAITAAIMDYGNDPMKIITRFGVKLITTFVGLGVRVYLTNFRPSIEDLAENVEESLAQAAQRMRERLDRITVDLDSLSSALMLTLKFANERVASEILNATATTNAAFSETLTAMKGETLSTLEDLRNATTTVVAEATNAITSMVRGMEGSTTLVLAEAREGVTRALADVGAASARSIGAASTELERSLAELRVRIDGATNGIGVTTLELVEKLRSTELPQDIFVANLEPAVSRLVTAMDRPGTSLQALAEVMSRGQEHVGAAALSFETLATQGRDAERELGRLIDRLSTASSVDAFAQSIAGADTSLNRLANAAEEGTRRLAAANELSDELARKAEQRLAQIRERAGQLDEDQIEALRLIAELREFSAAARKRAGRGIIGRIFGGDAR